MTQKLDKLPTDFMRSWRKSTMIYIKLTVEKIN